MNKIKKNEKQEVIKNHCNIGGRGFLDASLG
jgi:hypothetical protein